MYTYGYYFIVDDASLIIKIANNVLSLKLIFTLRDDTLIILLKHCSCLEFVVDLSLFLLNHVKVHLCLIFLFLNKPLRKYNFNIFSYYFFGVPFSHIFNLIFHAFYVRFCKNQANFMKSWLFWYLLKYLIAMLKSNFILIYSIFSFYKKCARSFIKHILVLFLLLCIWRHCYINLKF